MSFFLFYEEIQGKEEELEKIIQPWQEEKYSFFRQLKEILEEKKEEYLAKEFLWNREKYHPENLKEFSRIVFFDIPSFPRIFQELFSLLEKDFDLEFVLQVSKEDFDEEHYMLRQVSPVFF